ncbi:Lrp/AsnC family transcriptional regulator [Caldivirga sp. UBA161]|uniref:Lrp/AsnC family transcriptional regulator n=1 Tax=Caldivirga sp. UBA161 TaxID=1915569 RepID=UPI0025BD568A|nr:Lrp/AsnC family transcriptional regulator [Caldivirga sp. UBA161]
MMDELDIKILESLQRNGRITVSRLAELLNKPRTTIMSRLARLESSKIILGYKTVIDPAQMGYTIQAYVLLTVRRIPGAAKPSQVALAERIIYDSDNEKDLPWVEEAQVVTGQYDLVLKVWAKDLKQLSNFLIRYLPTHPDVVKSETMIVLENVATWRNRNMPIR